MSWDSLNSQDYLSGGVSHQLSATRLLSSPEGSRHPLDTTSLGGGGWPPWVSNTAPLGGSSNTLDSYSSLHRATDGGPFFRGGSRMGSGSDGLRLRGDDRHGARGYGVWGCFRACQARIHHRIAKRKMEQGVKLYNQHKQQQAVRKWKSALKMIRKREDKFTLLGYLYQAYMDWGKYRDSLEFAHRQLCISEELDSANMRAESYLNLARAHEKLGGLERALAYARQSLYNECEKCTTAGHVHLTVGSVYLELAGFNKALDSFQHAHKIAQSIQDPALELQVYVGLSELFSRLQDADKSARYAAKAYDLSRSLQLGDLNSRHHRAALLQMASALRKQGELGDAQDYCSEATRLALVSGDQATYARSIRIMGDIYRKKSDVNKAFRQYECAMGSAAAMADRVIQMESMDGAARCLEALRLQHKICNCRPLEFNTRLLEVASSVGAKMLVRTVRTRLARIYSALGDEEQKLHHERVALRLQQDLDLQCGACGSPYGLEADSLEALPCAHILHARISGACHELGVDVKGPPTPPLPPPDTLLTTTQAQNHLETTYHQQTHPKNQQRHRLDHLDLHTTTSQTTMTTTSYLQTPGYGHQRHHSDDASYRKDHQYYQYYKHPEAARPQNGEHHNNCSAGYKVLSGQDSLAKKDQLLLLDPTVDKARQLQAPILPTEAPNRKDIPMTSLNLPKRSDQLCPKHSPQLPSKDYKPQPEQTKLSEIISPPVQYSPKSKCKHDLIQFDASFQLPSPPKDDPFAKKPLMTSYPDDTELKLPRKASKKGQPVRNISHCQIGDLPVPPPAQYSPRSSTRRREFDHSSICGLPVPPPPVQLSPKAKHIHWKQGETIATLSIIRPVKPSEGQQTNIDTGLTTKSSLSTSQSRMEKFLSQAVSVQSTLAPIRIPKSSLLGLALHQPPAEAEKHCKPTHQRRYSVHSTEIIETLSHGLDPSKLNTSPSHQKLSCESGTTDSPVKPKRPLSRDVSTDSQDLTLKMEGATKKERILSRDASTDSEDLIKFEEKPPLPPTKSRSRQNSVEIVEPETEPSPKGPTTSSPARPTRATRDPLLKSFSVDESCRLPPFLSPTLFVDINQPVQQYNISAMVSPSKQLQNNLKQGSSHLFLAPRRSWQDIGFHRPSQPNLDVLLASEEAALSPIWLPKQPLEPLRSPKHRRPSKDQSAAKALSRKDNLSPSNSFTRSRRSSHENMADELVHIVTKKDKDESPLGRSNSFNRPKKLLSASRRSSEEQITSPKSPRKRFSPSTSIDRTKSQELIVITSETTIIKKDLLSPTSSFRSRKHSEDSSGTPKPRRKKVSPSQSSQELIYISSASSPTKKTSISPSASVTTLRRPSKESLSSPKSPRKKSVTPSDSLDKMKSGTQELIIISTEAPQVENMASPKSPRRRRKSSKDGVSPSSSFCSSRRSSKEDLASPKSPRKKNLSPSSSFSLSSRRSSREDNNIAVVSISSPTSPRKKSVSPSNSFTRKQFTPIPSRKNSLSPSASFSISRSSPIPIPSPKRSCLSRSNSFNAKSKIFSQTLSIEIPSSPLVLSRSGSINDNLSPPKHQSLLSPALEAALISEITAKLSGVHRSISPQTTKHSRGTSPKSTCIYATISPQKSVEIPECVSPSISGISSQVSIEFPDISPISPLKSFSDTSPYLSLEVPIMLEHSSQATSFDTSTNVSPETIPKIDMQHLQQQQNQVSSVVGLKSPQKSPKMSPIQCPIHVEIHVRLPKDDNDKLIATKCQGTQIP